MRVRKSARKYIINNTIKASRRYAADIVLRSREGKLLPAGSYTLVGYLTTKGSESGIFSAIGSLAFEVRDLH